MKHDRVCMPLTALISEHKKLLRVLKSNDKKQMRDEARDQKRELDKYLKRRSQ